MAAVDVAALALLDYGLAKFISGPGSPPMVAWWRWW
jgi:hypothetical protein